MIGIKTKITLNDVEVDVKSNTILSAGFNLIGKRVFDASYTSQAYWVRFDIDAGNVTTEGTYTEIASSQHEVVGVYTLVLAAPANVTGFHLMKANTTNDSDRVVSLSISSLTVNNGDTLKIWWEFYIYNPDNTWTTNGLKMIGHRCFDKTNTYNPVSHIAYWQSGSQQKIYAQSYSGISDTIHIISVTLDSALTPDSLRFYSASVSGVLYWEATGSRSYPNGYVHNYVGELSQ